MAHLKLKKAVKALDKSAKTIAAKFNKNKKEPPQKVYVIQSGSGYPDILRITAKTLCRKILDGRIDSSETIHEAFLTRVNKKQLLKENGF